MRVLGPGHTLGTGDSRPYPGRAPMLRCASYPGLGAADRLGIPIKDLGNVDPTQALYQDLGHVNAPPCIRLGRFRFTPDTPHGLAHVGESAARKSRLGFAQAPEPRLVCRRAGEDAGPWPREAPPRQPHPRVPDPSCGRLLPRWSLLRGQGRSRLLQGLTDAVHSGRLDEPPARHHLQQGQEALGLLQRARGGDTRGVVQQSAPHSAGPWPVAPSSRAGGGRWVAARAGVATRPPQWWSRSAWRDGRSEAKAPAEGVPDVATVRGVVGQNALL